MRDFFGRFFRLYIDLYMRVSEIGNRPLLTYDEMSV